jgi:SET domain-containing protein
MSQRIPSLFIGPSNLHQRGVFTTEPIPKDSLIEICAIIKVPADQLKLLKKTVLYNYYFDWHKNGEDAAIVLGYGSLYNHSFQPNAEYSLNYDDETIEIYALRDIDAGEELTFNYNGDPMDHTTVWFQEE